MTVNILSLKLAGHRVHNYASLRPSSPWELALQLLVIFKTRKKNNFSVLKKENKLEETWLLWALTGPGRLGAEGVGWTRCQGGRRTLVQRCPLGWDQVSAAGRVGWRPVEVRAWGTSVSFSFLKAARRVNWSATRGFLCVITGFFCKQVGMQHRLSASLMTFWTTTEKIAKWL